MVPPIKINNRTIQVLIFLAVQLLTLTVFILRKHYDYLLETFFVISVSFLLPYLETKKNIYIPDYLRAFVFIALSGHTVGGQLLNFYTLSAVYDKFLHFFGIYTFASLFFILLRLNHIQVLPIIRFVLIVSIGLSLGTLYEIWEFTLDQLTKPAVPAQGGLLDTDLDLIFDLAGSILAALHINLRKGHA